MYSTVISVTSSLLVHGLVIAGVLLFQSKNDRATSRETQMPLMFEVSFHESSVDSQPSATTSSVIASGPSTLAPAVTNAEQSQPHGVKVKKLSVPQKIERKISELEGPVESSAVSERKGSSGSESQVVRRGSEALQLSHWLARHRFYPHEAKRRREEGTVVLRVTLDAHGDLGSYQIVSSSGSSALDKAARDIIRRAAPYPETILAQGNHYEIPLVFSLS